MYKTALKTGFYDLTSARDFYREATKAAGIGMHHDLIKYYLELQALLLTPIAPHWAEYMWLDVLKKPETIQAATFPSVPSKKANLTAAREYVRSTSSSITSAEGSQQKKQAKGKQTMFDPKKDKSVTIFTAQNYPVWQDKCIDLVREAFNGMTLDVKSVSQKLEKSETKRAMPFVQSLKKRLESGENTNDVFERRLPFDEVQVLKEMAPGLRQILMKCKVVEIVNVEEGGKNGTVIGGSGQGVKERDFRSDLPQSAESAMPGSPSFHFENL